MMLHTALITLVTLLQIGLPSIQWTASTQTDQDAVSIVFTGQVRDGYYTHPMSDPYTGPSIEWTLPAGVTLAGDAVEEYEAADYKGEEVIKGTYVIRQQVLVEKKAEVRGTLTFQSCQGDACGMPEDWDFAVSVSPAPGAGTGGSPLWALILEAILWGLAMLLTPCVFPMVPMTVSFFIKGSQSKAQGRFRAAMYGLFIVLLYTIPICVIIGLTWILGGESVTADIFNWLATHWLPNILFFIIFMIFAASFFGAFELRLPSKWVNDSDKNSDSKGLGGIFFLALTLVLVSFSCTGPIVGTVLIKSTQGEFWTPMVTMLAFSIAFALPFTLLAFFPSLLKNLPKSGGWLNSVKVVLGFIEIALGLKFLSVADQTYHWHLLDREVYLAIWITVFSLLGLYLLGKIRFANDSPQEHIGVGRLTLVIAVFSFVVYMIPGMWGAPLKAISGYLPPIETQDFVLDRYTAAVPAENVPATAENQLEMPHGLVAYDNLEDGLKAAAESGRHVFVDITGYGCVNCREMESRVWSDPKVLELMRQYVMVALYNDDKTRLPEEKWVTTAEGRVLKDVGRVNAWIARERFGVNAQPNYALLDAEGNLLAPVRGYDLSIDGFVDFLESGL
ncbi:MAG: thioredoxin family protein [Bacteroidales bacterium]|nr:thioredoxin family protein [Bacteroidales bacterium]